MASSARIDELLQKFGENPRRYFAPLANEYRKMGDLDQAIALCRDHLIDQPGHMSGHIVYGQALFEKGERDEAGRVFVTALALDPENLIALRHLGDIARGRADYEAARQWYQRVLDADPRNEEILAEMDAVAREAAENAPEGGELPFMAVEEEAPAAEGAAPPPSDDAEPASPAGVPEPSWLSGPDGGGALGTETHAPPAEPALPAFDMAAMDAATEEFVVDPEDVALVVPATERSAPPAYPRDELAGPAPARASEFRVPPLEPVHPGSTRPGDTDVPAEPLPMLGLETQEFHPPEVSSVSSEPLGFETTEFVPPPRASAAVPPADRAPAPPRADAAPSPAVDPMVGRSPAEHVELAETPAAFVTETMAELYLQQGFADAALDVYRQLLQQQPDDDELRARVARLESDLANQSSATAATHHVAADATLGGVPAFLDAPPMVEAPPRAGRERTIRELFAAVAARRPPTSASPFAAVSAPAALYADSPPPENASHDWEPEAEAPRPELPSDAAQDGSSGGLGAADVAVERRAPAFDGEPAGADDARDWQADPVEPAWAQPDAAPAHDELASGELPSAGEPYADAPHADVLGADAPEADLREAHVLDANALDETAPRADDLPFMDLTEEPPVGLDVAPAAPPTAPAPDEAYEQPPASGFADHPPAQQHDERAWSADEPPAQPASLDALFGGAGGRTDDASAAVLSNVYSEPPKQPPSSAQGTSSLDQFFRETPRSAEAARRASSFSFDEFFSAAPAQPATPAPPDEEPQLGDDPSSSRDDSAARDIEQFNAWLEGLKEK